MAEETTLKMLEKIAATTKRPIEMRYNHLSKKWRMEIAKEIVRGEDFDLTAKKLLDQIAEKTDGYCFIDKDIASKIKRLR